jgi:hypothetical protein
MSVEENRGAIRLQAYLRQVRHGLTGLPADEVDDIEGEIRSHVLDRLSGAAMTDTAVEGALKGFGPARDLAGLYLAERMAERVEARRSPWLILKTVWRLGGLSMRAFFVFLVSLVGYVTGAGFLLCALLKPVMPSRVGLWVSEGTTLDDLSFSFGITDRPGVHEVLGWWIIPVSLVLGLLCLWLTWRFGLASVRKLGRARAELLSAKA